MKVKDIIAIQSAMINAMDFISTNGDADETDATSELMNELSLGRKALQKKRANLFKQC